MIDVRDNWRVLLLAVLCILAGLALFGPLGSGDDGFEIDPPTPEPLATETTDETGAYATELPAGEYDVLVEETGYERFEGGVEVTGDNTTTFDIDLTARETGTVSGLVSDADGPVGGVTIDAVDNETGELERTIEVAADGTYQTTLETGEYVLNVDEIGFGPGRATVTVTADEALTQDITLERVDTGIVAGSLTGGGDPLEGVDIAVSSNATGEAVTTVTTGAGGSYEVELETGEVDLRVDSPLFETATVTQLVEADEAHTVDIDLDPLATGTVAGTVTAGGEPVPGVAVAALDLATGSQQAAVTTDSAGGYELELGVGTYEAVVEELLYSEFEQEFEVTADERTALDIELDRLESGTVEGVVSDDDGTLADIDVNFIDPDAGLGEDIETETFRDPTNLQYGLELSGGARIRGQLQGLTAEGLTMTPEERSTVEGTVADELGIDRIDVTAIVDSDVNAVEIYTQNVTRGAFADALGVAGQQIDADDIRNGVTEGTRQGAVDTITQRVDNTGFGGADVFTSSAVTGENFIVAEVPGVTRGELRDIISETGRVQIIAGFPDADGTYNLTELLTDQDDISDIGRAQPATAEQPSPHVPITLTQRAGERFASVMREAGFTNEGVGNCFFDQEVHDSPAPEHENQYCLFTVVDGEYVYGSSMGRDLAGTINAGGFEQNPSFIMQTGSFQEAQELEVNLRSGALPTDLDIVTESFISPSLAQLFKPLALLTAIMAWLTVCGVVYYWYRDVRVAVPMLLTASSEVFLLLGFAAAIGLALDLSHIAGLIAVIGTGLDDLIIMADEILQRKQKVETGRVFRSRFRKAFWIIGMAAATTIIAMSPLAVLSLGDLQGFAIVTIVGVLIGVLITRPAYGDVLRKLMLEDVKRK